MAARRFWALEELWMRSGELRGSWFVDSGGAMNTLLHRLIPEEDSWHYGPITRWDDDAMLKCDRTKTYRDVVFIGIREAVSSRTKAVIEDVAPKHAQFLPLTMMCGRSRLPVQPYWILNWNHQVDCWNERGNYLDAHRIPEDVEAFFVKNSNSAVFSDRIKRALAREKIDGCAFGRVRVEAGPRKPANPRRYLTKFDAPATLKPANNLKTRLASLKIKRSRPRDFVRAAVGDDATVEVGKGAGADAVKSLEKRLKLKLPENYRKFLTSCGSAAIEGVEIIGIPSRRSDPAAAKVTESMRKAKIFDWPAHLLCIAEDGRGGCYCLDTSKTRGADCPVVYFDHELATEDGATGRFKPRLEKIKPTFKSWLKEIALTGEPGPY